MRKKQSIIALQPNKAFPAHRAWSPERNLNTLSFCVALLVLVGLAFPINGANTTKTMSKPDIWQEQVRIGLLKIAYGWQNTPLLASDRASTIYTGIFRKTPKTGCQTAQERDWKVICPLISSQMSNNLDCEGNLKDAGAKARWMQSKADYLKNFEQSKTTQQYQCLYGA